MQVCVHSRARPFTSGLCRNMKLLGLMGTVLNEEDFFITARRVEARLDPAGPAAANAAASPTAGAAAMGSGSSAGT